MKILIKTNSLIFVSNSLSNFLAFLTGLNGRNGSKPAMGFAVFPFFIILKNLTHPMTEQWINHERIHIRQFLESLWIFWIYSKLEYLYARLFLKYSHIDAYRYESIEQEAYLNQSNMNYLKERKPFFTFKYMREKKSFYTDNNYNVIVDKKNI